jgi:hypothetical protein
MAYTMATNKHITPKPGQGCRAWPAKNAAKLVASPAAGFDHRSTANGTATSQSGTRAVTGPVAR